MNTLVLAALEEAKQPKKHRPKNPSPVLPDGITIKRNTLHQLYRNGRKIGWIEAAGKGMWQGYVVQKDGSALCVGSRGHGKQGAIDSVLHYG